MLCMAHGARCMMHGAWCMVHGRHTNHKVNRSEALLSLLLLLGGLMVFRVDIILRVMVVCGLRPVTTELFQGLV